MRALRPNPCGPFYALPLMLVALTLTLGGCVTTTPPVAKIGIIAPFEGRYRQIGYEVIPAARLAIREYAARTTHRDLAIEIVAFDDEGDPQRAVEQAQKLIADPMVKIVIGHWRDDTTEAALPLYRRAGLPVIAFSTRDQTAGGQVYNLAPSQARLQAAARDWLDTQTIAGVIDLDQSEDVVAEATRFLGLQRNASQPLLVGGPEWGTTQFYALTDKRAEGVYFVSGAAQPGDLRDDFWTTTRVEQFIAGFKQGSLGAAPGLLSVTAYQAAWLAISLIDESGGATTQDTPVAHWKLGPDGRRVDQAVYLYVWQGGNPVLVATMP